MNGNEKESKIACGIRINYTIFAAHKTESVAQLVRASVCGTEGRGFETPRSPLIKPISGPYRFLNLYT